MQHQVWDPKIYPIVHEIKYIDTYGIIDVMFTVIVDNKDQHEKTQMIITSDQLRENGKSIEFLKAFNTYFETYRVSKRFSRTLNASLTDIDWIPFIKI